MKVPNIHKNLATHNVTKMV